MNAPLRGTLPRKYIDPHQLIQGIGDLTLDAWGRPKVVNDFSLLHGLFTYDIPKSTWKESVDDVEILGAFANASSVDGKLHLESGALDEVRRLSSFKYPRYEPNRGQIYSLSAFFPEPSALGTRDFGMFTAESGVFFRLRNSDLYACRRTTISSVTTTTEELIKHVPDDLDFSCGNIFDIQMQWRGVGNILFFIGDPAKGVSMLVHIMDILGTSKELSIFNPALPIAFECTNQGAEVIIEAGCVDVSTEGGRNYDGEYGALTTSTDSGEVAVTGLNALVMAVKNLVTFDGLINTRDVLNLAINAYSDKKSLLRIWITRDMTAIIEGTQVWIPFRDGHIEYLEFDPGAGVPAIFDTAKAELQFGLRIPLGETVESQAVFDKAATLNMSPGDMLIFTIHNSVPPSGAAVGVTYEFSEYI